MKATKGGNCYVWTDDTVKDYKTGLVWQRGTAEQRYKWADAASYCSGLNLGGFSSGWRLPSLDELMGIVDKSRSGSPYIDTDAFPNTSSSWYWTSTPFAGDSGYAWYVSFDNGYSGYFDTTYTRWVRCVR
jgi:hypothetical protein